MKKNSLLLTAFCAFAGTLSFVPAKAQQAKGAWAGDINVNPATGAMYKNARISVGSDGAIYVGRLERPAGSVAYNAWHVLRSTDTGRTWTSVAGTTAGSTYKYTAFDMIVTGAGANYNLLVARAGVDSTSTTNASFLTLTSYPASGGTGTNMVS